MNEAASQLGKMAAGIPKNYSKDERERRRQQMHKLNRKRRGDSRAGNAKNRRTAKRRIEQLRNGAK